MTSVRLHLDAIGRRLLTVLRGAAWAAHLELGDRVVVPMEGGEVKLVVRRVRRVQRDLKPVKAAGVPQARRSAPAPSQPAARAARAPASKEARIAAATRRDAGNRARYRGRVVRGRPPRVAVEAQNLALAIGELQACHEMLARTSSSMTERDRAEHRKAITAKLELAVRLVEDVADPMPGGPK